MMRLHHKEYHWVDVFVAMVKPLVFRPLDHHKYSYNYFSLLGQEVVIYIHP